MIRDISTHIGLIAYRGWSVAKRPHRRLVFRTEGRSERICISSRRFVWPSIGRGAVVAVTAATPDEGDQDGDGEERQQTQARPPEGLGSDVMEMDGDELVIRGSLLCCRRPCERPLLCGSSPGTLTDLTTSPPSPPTSSAS